jgi:hypothetical protein
MSPTASPKASRSIPAEAATAAACVQTPATKLPITARRRLRIKSAIIGAGRARLNTTWLMTSDWVTS